MSDVVGQIKVRVRPDTTNFDKELLAKLNDIEKRQKPLRTKVDVDPDHFERSVRQARDRAQRSLDDIVVRMRLDDQALDSSALGGNRQVLDDLDQSIRDTQASADRLEESLRGNTHALGDLAPATRHVRDALDDLDLDVAADSSSRSSRGWRLAARGMDALSTSVRRLGSAGLRRVGGELAYAGRAMRSFTGWNVMEDINDRFKTMLENMDRLSVRTGLMTSGLLHFGGSLGNLLPSLAGFGVGLGQIVRGYGLAAPGALMGMAVGAIAFGVALKDINNQLPEVGQRFRAMAEPMRAAFWNEAREPMRDMFDRLLPGIAAGMNTVSASAGRFTADLSRAMGQVLEPRLPAFFENVAGGLETARAGTEGFANAFGVLMSVGSSYLPRFGSWMTRIGTQFGNFLTQAEASGDIFSWIDVGILRMRQLGSGLVNLGGTIGNVMSAMADSLPRPAMEAFDESMKALYRTTSDPQFKAGLTEGFVQLRLVMTEFSNTVGPAFAAAMGRTANTVRQNFGDVMDGLSQAMRGLFIGLASDVAQAGLDNAFKGIADGLRGMSEYLPALGTGLGALGTIIGDIGRQALPLLGQGFGHVSNLLDQLQPGISAFTNAIGPALSEALLQVGPALGRLAEALSPVIARVGEAGAKLLTQLAPGLTSVIDAVADSGALDAAGAAFEAIAQGVGNISVPLLKGLTDFVNNTEWSRLEQAGDFFKGMGEGVAEWLSDAQVGARINQDIKHGRDRLEFYTEAKRIYDQFKTDFERGYGRPRVKDSQEYMDHLRGLSMAATDAGTTVEEMSGKWATFANNMPQWADRTSEAYRQTRNELSSLKTEYEFDDLESAYMRWVRGQEEGADIAGRTFGKHLAQLEELKSTTGQGVGEMVDMYERWKEGIASLTGDQSMEAFDRYNQLMRDTAANTGQSVQQVSDSYKQWYENMGDWGDRSDEAFAAHESGLQRMQQKYGEVLGHVSQAWDAWADKQAHGADTTLAQWDRIQEGLRAVGERNGMTWAQAQQDYDKFVRAIPPGVDSGIAAYETYLQKGQEFQQKHGAMYDKMVEQVESGQSKMTAADLEGLKERLQNGDSYLVEGTDGMVREMVRRGGLANTGAKDVTEQHNQGLAGMVQGAIEAAANAGEALLSGLIGLGAGVFSSALELVAQFGQGLLQLPMIVWEALSGLGEILLTGITGLGTFMFEGAMTLVTSFGEGLATLPGQVAEIVSSAVESFSSGLSSLVSAGLAKGSETVSSFASGLAALPGQAAALASSALSSFQGALSGLPGIASSLASGALSGFQGMLSGLPGIASSLASGATSSFQGALSPLPGIASSMGSSALSAFQGLVGSFHSVGANIGNAVANGLRSALGAVQAAASAIIAAARSAANAAAQIQSPSRVFMEIGRMLGLGMAIGIERERSAVASSVESLIDAASGVIPAALTVPMSAEVSAYARQVAGSIAPLGADVAAGGGNITITNHYPQAEPASRTIARAQQLKAIR